MRNLTKQDYKILYEYREGYLYVHISGPESLNAAVNFWKELKNKIKKHKVAKIMVVDEVTGRLNVINHYEISMLVGKLFTDKKIAFIDPKKETFDLNKYGETIVRDQGGYAQVFHNEEDGVKWLLSDE